MGFFDLNIPYFDSGNPTADKSTAKTSRLKLIIKSMELGYTGVAYNRTIKGVLSESDRCTISLFPLSSILKLAPSLSTSVNLHRGRLNVPLSAPFRQYTRLTVIVDSSSQALALNSGNPILKSYDIVAVRPVNQNAFDQTCQASEVDLIAIDFSEKLPFRLKLPMVKAAIERGVYFEITYSSLIMYAQVRRQMISNAKLLVDYTRGKNLILSSAAHSVTELRGPYDVANLSSLLGLPMERAKAAISKSCRSLITNASRNKQCYKEAIRVEVISSGEHLDAKESGYEDWLEWDSISSGEGDLLLDDMAKSFYASSKASKTVKAVDFASVVDGLPSHGLQIKHLISLTKATSEPPYIGKKLSAAVETEVPVARYEVSEKPGTLKVLPHDTPAKHQTSGCEDSKMPCAGTDTVTGFFNAEELVNRTAMTKEELEISNGLDVYFASPETEVHDLQSQSCVTICDTYVKFPDDNATVQTLVKDTEIASACNAVASTAISTPSKDVNSSALESEESKRLRSLDVVLGAQDFPMDEVLIETDISTPSKDVNSSALQNEESKRSNTLEVVLGARDVAMDGVITEPDIKNKLDLYLASCDVSLHEGFPEREQFMETGDDLTTLADGLPLVESYYVLENNIDYSVSNHVPPEEVATEERQQIEDHSGMNYPALRESPSGKGRVKRRTSHRTSLFPFRHLLNPLHFKKKARKLKRKIIAT